MKITKNAIKCLLCNEEIESKFVTAPPVKCTCGNVALSGGLHEIRIIGGDFGTFEYKAKFTYENEHECSPHKAPASGERIWVDEADVQGT